jgi:hypothetical protein
VIVLAVDPGKMTGWATWSEGKFMAGQMPYLEFLVWAESMIPHYAPFDLHVVSEAFIISQRTVSQGKDAHWSIGSNAILDYWCQKYEVPFSTQTASEGKRFADDEKLKRIEWYQSTPGGHRNDAVRHLVVYLVKHGRLPLSTLSR